MIFKNLAELSGGELKLDENTVLSSHQDLRGTKKFFHKNPKHKNNNHKHKNPRKF